MPKYEFNYFASVNTLRYYLYNIRTFLSRAEWLIGKMDKDVNKKAYRRLNPEYVDHHIAAVQQFAERIGNVLNTFDEEFPLMPDDSKSLYIKGYKSKQAEVEIKDNVKDDIEEEVEDCWF